MYEYMYYCDAILYMYIYEIPRYKTKNVSANEIDSTFALLRYSPHGDFGPSHTRYRIQMCTLRLNDLQPDIWL